MNEDIKHIEDEIRAWERAGRNLSFLDELIKEPTQSLADKYREIKKLEKHIKRFTNNPTYVEPFTILLYKEAVKHEIRKRKWSWPIVKFLFPFSRWYTKTFRGKGLIDDRKYFGPRTTRDVLLKKSLWHENILFFMKPVMPFVKRHLKFIITTLLAIIGIIVAIILKG